MAPSHDDMSDIDAIAALARAEAEAAAIRARAEIDAQTVRATADADAAAVRARAHIEAAAMRRVAEDERREAQALLAEARRQTDGPRLAFGDARRTERETLDRLLATRADLHDAIERLTAMSEPVLDLTDGGMALADSAEIDDTDLVPLAAALDDRNGRSAVGTRALDGAPAVPVDPVEALVRSAIGRAVDSASTRDADQTRATEQPARRREQLRDGRNVL